MRSWEDLQTMIKATDIAPMGCTVGGLKIVWDCFKEFLNHPNSPYYKEKNIVDEDDRTIKA